MPPTEIISSKIISNPPKHGTGRVMSAHVPPIIYDTALKSAELLGCESISEFVRDAICEKIELTMRAMSNIAKKNMSTYKTFDPTTEF